MSTVKEKLGSFGAVLEATGGGELVDEAVSRRTQLMGKLLERTRYGKEKKQPLGTVLITGLREFQN